MADENDNSLYMAGGAKIFNQMEKNTAKQDKIANQQQQIVDEVLRDKAKSVANIKSISTTQGGKPLTTTNIASVLGTVATSITNRINQMSLNTTKQFLPIDSQLKQVNDLISSNRDGDIDKGFELIDKLQSRLGVDLGKYSKEIGDSVQKLYDMNRQRKEDKAEANRIQKEKTEELTIERDILREQGINTYVNEKTLKLEIKSKSEEKAEKKRLQKEEQRLQDEEKNILKQTKELKKLDRSDEDRAELEEFVLARSENLSKDKKKFEEDKSKANVQPGQRVSGPLDQTIGEAFRQIKGFGKEIGQLGGDLFKGFGKLAGMVGRVAMGFLALLKPLIPFILIAVMIGVVIYALYKAIKAVIDFFADIFEGISKIWPFSLLKDDDSKNEDISDPNKTAVPGQVDKQSPQTETDIQKRTGQGQMVNRNEIDGETAKDGMTFEPGRDSDAMKILPINAEGGEDRRSISQMTKNVRSQNLNQMSVDNQALNESKPTNNTVVAPNISNSSVNASNTQVSSMEPTNFDRSFINLNSVAI
jgi:hypothetical protein